MKIVTSFLTFRECVYKCLWINDLLFSVLPSVKIVNGVRVGVNVYGDQISKNVKSKSANWSSFSEGEEEKQEKRNRQNS